MQKTFQNFNFSDGKNQLLYDVIWIQWCVENIDDDDLHEFLIKSKQSFQYLITCLSGCKHINKKFLINFIENTYGW